MGRDVRFLPGPLVAIVVVVGLSGCILTKTGEPRFVANEELTLRGQVYSAEQGQTEVWAEYGLTTSYGSTTDRMVYAVGEDAWVDVAVEVDGLTPVTTYHYRICATKVGGGGNVRCGDDRAVTTGIGRRSVEGEATDGSRASPAFAQVHAVVDPGYGGYMEGVATYSSHVQTPTHPPLAWGGTGDAQCVRVEGNVATIGFSWNDPILGFVAAVLAIEDNGPTGDRFELLLDQSACPQPDPSLFRAGTGPVVSGDFVVDDG